MPELEAATAQRSLSAKLGAVYTALAVHAMSTLLFFVAANLIASIALTTCMSEPTHEAIDRPMSKLRQVYPTRNEADIRALLKETWSRQYIYQPFTQFREADIHGTYLNISAPGFRHNQDRPDWPPTGEGRTVFVFGGSTTFGYGLADSETIPSHLQAALRDCEQPVTIYNFARSNYYSTQERVLFQQLLSEGHIPDVALFVDGLNEFNFVDDEPKYSARLRQTMSGSEPRLIRRMIAAIPIVKLLKRMRAPGNDWAPEKPADEVEPLALRILNRQASNRRLIAAAASAYGVRSLFVWQPVPVYEYDLAHHVWHEENERLVPQPGLLRRGYELMNERRLTEEPPIIWLGDMQRERKEPLYVDRVHYSAEFSRDIAAQIAAATRQVICANPAN